MRVHQARAINNRNQVVGGYWLAITSLGHALLWENGQVTILPDPPGGGNAFDARAINDQGQIVGQTFTFLSHGFIWQTASSTPTDLGSLDSYVSPVTTSAINNKGQVVGQSHTAFLWQNGVMTDLGTLPGDTSSNARSINAGGLVVGTSINGTPHNAFIWNGTIHNLNDLIPSKSGWNLTEAQGINDVGQIVGIGQFNGQGHYFLLTPH